MVIGKNRMEESPITKAKAGKAIPAEIPLKNKTCAGPAQTSKVEAIAKSIEYPADWANGPTPTKEAATTQAGRPKESRTPLIKNAGNQCERV